MWSFWLFFCDCALVLDAVGLQFLLLLSAFWWMRIRGLCKLPDRRDWLWRKLGLALVSKAMPSKSLIICLLCSLAVSFLAWTGDPVWPSGDPALECTGSMVRLLVTSKRTYANTRLPELLLPSLQQATADLHLHKRPSSTHRQVQLSHLWGDCFFPLGPSGHTVLFMPSKGLCFPQSCWSSIIKSCCPLKSDSLGISNPLLDPRVGKSDVGPRAFATVRELLWHCCSPVYQSPTRQVWDLILSWLCLSYHLHVASPLSLDVGCLFLDKPTVCYTKLIKSERGKQLILMHIYGI